MKRFIIRILNIYIVIAIACLSVYTRTPIAASENENSPVTVEESLLEVERVIVPYITLRNKNASTTSLEKYYGGTRDKPRAGICEVSFTPIKGMQSIAEAAPFYIPDRKSSLTSIEEMSLDDFFNDIKLFTKNKNESIVLYIHGYNIGFWKSCRRSAMFQQTLELQDRLLLFSWPADGNALKYTWDESDLYWSVSYITQVLAKLISLVGKDKVDVVAHSLGARGAFLALLLMAERHPERALINELILVAPDIDADIFEQNVSTVREAAARVTLYVSDNDSALKVSEELHGYPRLGQAGEELRVMKGVETIDISLMSRQRISGHIYHIFNQQVMADIKMLLHGGEGPDQRPLLKVQAQNGLPFWQMVHDYSED